MIFRGRHVLALAIVAAASPWKSSNADAAATIRASCMEGNQVVYREDIPRDAPESRRAQIIARNPKAMCVFLEMQDAASIGVPISPKGTPGIVRLPDVLVAAAAGRTTIPDAELSAALSAITGSEIPAPPKLSLTAPTEPAVHRSSMQAGTPPSGKTVNLTLGIYRSVPLAEVMEHWRLMSSGTRALSKMTPTITRDEDITMLSLEGVTDDEAETLCDEARDRGVGCLAAY